VNGSRYRGVRGSIDRSHRGKKTPTLCSQGREARRARFGVAGDDPPKRSSDAVKRPDPRSYRAKPKTSRGVPAAKAASGAGNARGAGARSSFGWQTSVGRIARLLHREVARPVGEPERALAGRKFVAPLTWGADGQKAKRCAGSGFPDRVFRTRPAGYRLQVRQYDGRRSRAFARLLLPAGEVKALWLAGQLRITLREERDDGQRIGRRRIPTRACLRVTTGTSEVDTTR